MDHHIFTYLKRKGLTDIRMVNRIFVSAFMRYYNVVSMQNVVLIEHYIEPGDADENLLDEFIKQLEKNNCKYSLEELIELFEFVISPHDRKVTGAVYTPYYIRDRIVREVTAGLQPNQLYHKRFADIACGCGGFFLTVAQLLHQKCNKSYDAIYRENLFGVDIQEYSIQRTKILLSLLALTNGEDTNFTFNLYVANSLAFDYNEIKPLDFIVGNPPYVCSRNIPDESRKLLANWSVCASGNTDLYIAFFQMAMESVCDGGKIGFITMNSFMTSLNGFALREYFHTKKNDIRIVDFKGYQLFPGKSTYTCLFFLTKITPASVYYCINSDAVLPDKFRFNKIEYTQMDAMSGWKLNATSFAKHAESVGIPLGQYCQTRHGIATLANNVYVFRPKHEEEHNYVFEKRGVEYKVEKEICRKIINSNKFNSDIQLENIIEYVIYPYRINTDGKIEAIDEETMLHRFPLAYSYLARNRKILEARDKGRIENYPIWYAFGRTQSLIMPKYKLFFPKIANKRLNCVLCDDVNLLLYNGISFVSNDKIKLQVLKRIMESSFFWDYVALNSKPYSSDYFSLNGVNIKYFGIPNFSTAQIKELISLKEKNQIEIFLEAFYKE